MDRSYDAIIQAAAKVFLSQNPAFTVTEAQLDATDQGVIAIDSSTPGQYVISFVPAAVAADPAP